MNEYLKNTPLLKFLIPIICGITICHQPIVYPCSIGICGIILYVICVYSKQNASAIFPYAFFCIICSLSCFNAHHLNDNTNKPLDTGSKIFFRIDDVIHNDKSMMITGAVTVQIDSLNQKISTNNQFARLTIQGNNYNIKAGSIISFYPNFEGIKNLGNPYEFDNINFLNKKNIYIQQYVRKNEYVIVGNNPSLKNIASNIRSTAINKILNSPLSPMAQEFMIAILLGEKSYLDKDIKELYSINGMAHILALSGFHLGVLGLIIYFILFPLDYLQGKRLRICLTLMILCMYAFITGASPSIMRALVMAIFAGISILLYRNNSIYNAICGAAILILLINPMELYGIGFQLSFLAVISIITFTEILNPFSRKQKVYFHSANWILLPTSAYMGTAILSAYYFNNIPVYFLIPNLIIIPLFPIIVATGLIAIIFDSTVWSNVFNTFHYWMNELMNWNASLPFSNIKYINIEWYQILLYYCVLIFLFIAIKRNKFKYIMMLTFSVILFGFSFSWHNNKSTNKIIIFNDYDETPILICKDKIGYFSANIDSVFTDNFEYRNSKFIAKEGIVKIHNYEKNIIPEFISSIHIHYNKKRFVLINDKINMPANEINERLKIDYLIITRNYYSSIQKLCRIYNPANIIITGNIYEERRNELIRECKELNLPYYSIIDNGAFILE